MWQTAQPSASSRPPTLMRANTQTYTLLDNAGGRFAIDGNKLVVANGSLLNFEAKSHA